MHIISNKEEILEEMLAGFEKAILDVFKDDRKIDAGQPTPITEAIFRYMETHQKAFYALAKGHEGFERRLVALFHGLFTEKSTLKPNLP